MQKKKGISLIVLIITIIIMIILASAVVITFNNSGIINKANESVELSNLNEIKQIASLAWSEAYIDNMHIKDGNTRLAKLEEAVNKSLENIDTSGYNIIVDDNGVTITLKEKVDKIEAGLYDARGKLLASWDDLINKYGVDFYSYRNRPSENPSTLLGNVINSNEELKTAFEFRIPEEYTTIKRYAFYECRTLSRIIIPESVITIEQEAFVNCSALIEVCNKSSLNIVVGEDTYGRVARNAKIVTTYESQTKLKVLGDFVFYDDDINVALVRYIGNSSQISLPMYEKKYAIYTNAFYNDTNLTNVVIPDSVTDIGNYAFSGCTSLESINIPDSVTSIGLNAFNKCRSLTSINLPKGVTKIAGWLFADCESLKEVNLPQEITEIHTCAFYGCKSLTNINIPQTVTSIRGQAFDQCNSLTTITFEGTVEQWNVIEKNSNWADDILATEVICTDGTVML